MKTRLLAAVLLLSLAPSVVLPSGAAFAQDDASTKMARQRFQEGVAYYDRHEYELARAAFLQAYALHKHPAVLLNLAQSCLKSGHALEAARYFQQFLKDYSAATAAQRSDAEAGLADARTRIGRIDVSSAPAGSEILVDGESIGVAPFDHPIDVEPGSHTVKSHGHTDETVTVLCSAGQLVSATFEAAPPPPPAPASSSEPGLLTPPSNLAPAIAGAIITAAGVGTAIVFAIEKGSAQDSANSVAAQIEAHGGGQGSCLSGSPNYSTYANACSTLSSDNNNVNTDALIANVAAGVGIAAGVFTVVYWAAAWKGGSSPSTGSTVIAPMVGRGVGGLSLGTSF